MIGWELGYRRLVNKHLYVDLASFWNQYGRLQSFSAPIISTSGGITYITTEYTNQIGGEASGFEIAPQFDVTPWWRFNTSYSYLNSDFHALGRHVGHQRQRLGKHLRQVEPQTYGGGAVEDRPAGTV